MKSDVYFIKNHTNDLKERLDALSKLINQLDPFAIYKKGEFVPIKITIGDAKCIYNISPDLVKIVVSDIKKRGARPFLFDTNVIYSGSRTNAIDHLILAQNKGFSQNKIGAPYIVADGLFGSDGKEYELDSEYIKKIKVPSFIGMLENLLVLSHATCHIITGYAGAIKNVAMGMCSRPTKQVQHSSLKPSIIEKKCASCGCCIEICPAGAISRDNANKVTIDSASCIGCGECICACRFDAIYINWKEDVDIFAKRIAEVASFILSRFKNKFFITFAFDITKECDCISTSSDKIICKDIGILASYDIVALDKATSDLINKDDDLIFKEKSTSSYKTTLEYVSKKGLGNLDYRLIEL